MRGRQLSEIASAALEGRDVAYQPVGTPFRRSDLFLTKGALKVVDAAQLLSWRRAGNRLFADPVDEALASETIDLLDVVVAASRTALDDYRETWPYMRVEIVDHHVDPRVHAAMAQPVRLDGLNAGYFGERVNTIRSRRIARRVDFIQVSTAVENDDWFDVLPRYNLHYAVRRARALDSHKPFLKGFTAAACASNIIIQADQPEARRWLPSDYPFWLRDRVTEQSILASIEHAREAYRGPLWRAGLDMMRDVADRTSNASIGSQLVTLFA